MYLRKRAVSDVFSEWALRQAVEFLPRVAKDGGDRTAKSTMLCVPVLPDHHLTGSNIIDDSSERVIV